MRLALPRPFRLGAPWPAATRTAERTRSRISRRRRRPPRLLRDPYLGYTAAMLPIGALVLVLAGAWGALLGVIGLSVPVLAAQTWLGSIPTRLRPLTPLGWSFLRLSVTLVYVAVILQLSGGAGGPMPALLLPLVMAAAVLGPIQAVVIGGVAALIYLAPELTRDTASTELALRGITLAGISVLIAVGTRRLVTTLERTSRQLRSAILAERRRSRQFAGMEEVSRRLMGGGPTREVLDQALGVLHERFGYNHVSIYLAEGDRLVLGAQRGYLNPIPAFDGTAGVVGRVMRSRLLEFVTDVTTDPDYIAVHEGVRSEICAPLLVDGQLLGILNVESREPLERSDREVVAGLADRVATVVALGRDRQALAERGAVFRRLHEFTQAVSAALDLDRLAAEVVDATRRVVPADIVALTVLDRQSARYRVRALTDADPAILGGELRIGEGLAGRAIRDRTLVIDPQFEASSYPQAYRSLAFDEPALGAGIPLIRDGVVVGAISLIRRDREQSFRSIEREAMELLAGHVALAVSNAFLHAEVEELAIRDPLTGLYNRRYLDETLDRIIAAWHRTEPAQRRPISAVLFDLDHFGDFNKQHGHQVGDRVLRTFAALLRDRFRASDLVARLGGEEFVVILEGADLEAAERLADEVRTRLGGLDLVNEDGLRLRVTVSAGCSQLDEPHATREQLLRGADVALFMAKRGGRDRVVAA